MCVCVPSPLVSEVHAAEKKRECSRRLDAVAPKPSVASAGQGRELGRPERAEKTCCRAGRRVEALPSWAECEPALSRYDSRGGSKECVQFLGCYSECANKKKGAAVAEDKRLA
ncbi:unnamed protein product [Prorocentrum cordatum]|uniref:Uncharacterized protein n=1 Tax=Prorocentrum cordatum TaxID=2364126 RepID=A0ABN9Y6H2_9DINO|nr:unnamed protein product [Polarella glacialis]